MTETGRSGSRWLTLFAIVPIIISTETMWLSLAPVSAAAEKFYGVDGMSISLLAMSYMIMFVLFTFPASRIIDRYGYRTSLVIGSLITVVFGTVRAVFADSFPVVLASQFLIAIGQPFLLNISTKVPADRFPENERSTAAGILTMAQYIGFVIPMIVSPLLAETSGIPFILAVYAAVSVFSAIVALLFARGKSGATDGGAPVEKTGLREIGKLFSNRMFVPVLILSFISIGVFNTILSLIEAILVPRGMTAVQAGAAGAVFVASGIVGAVVLPGLSDGTGKKTPFFVAIIALLIPLYLVFTFAPWFPVVAAAAGIAGFAVMGVAPILFQYGAETAYPVREGTSLGTILLMGQVSGALFVFLFELLSDVSGSVVIPMLCIVALTAFELPVTLRMKETGARPDAGRNN